MSRHANIGSRASRRGKALAAATAAWAIVLTGLGAGAALGDDNPATAPLDQSCLVVPAASTGNAAGRPLVAQGETITVVQRLSFAAGTVYQDVFQRSDGSVYYASVLELDANLAEGIALDPASIALTLAGAPVQLLPGTEPSAASYVLDSSQSGLYRVYFPGDVAAMLADPTGHGVPSVTIPTGGAVAELSMTGTVTATTPGASATGAGCYASVSTGASNRNTTTAPAGATVAALVVGVDKSVDRAIASAGAELTYSVRVDVPTHDADGIPVGRLYDVSVVDTLPEGLQPVPDSISDGGTFADGIINWSLPVAEPGSTVTFTYRAIANAAPGTNLENAVQLSASSVAGAVPGERTVTAEDQVTMTVSGGAPTVTKVADVSAGAVGSTINYEVEVTIPAGADYYDVAIVDSLPDGLENPQSTSFGCTGCDAADPAPATLGPQLADGWELGYFLGDLGPAATDRTYTFRYSADIAATRLDGTAVEAGLQLDNIVDVVWNDSDQFDAPAGLLDRSGWDGSVSATDRVTVGVPALTIEKTLKGDAGVRAFPNSPDDALEYTISVENTSGVDAHQIVVTDRLDTGYPRPAVSAVTASAPTGATVTHAYSLTEPWITWSYAGPLAPGDVLEWDVAVVVPAGTSATDPFSNAATVDHLEDASGVSHDVPPASAVDVDFALPRLTPSKTLIAPISGAVAPGDTTTWQLTIVNDGEVPTDGFRVCDVPTGGSYIAGSLSDPSITVTTPGTAACGIQFVGSSGLAVGESVTFTYQTTVPVTAAAGPASNSATAFPEIFGQTTRTLYGGTTVGGTDSADVTVVIPALTLSKTPNASQNIPIQAGGASQYQLVVTNTSSTVDAVNVVVSDVLPSHLSYPGGFTAAANPAPTPTVTPSAGSAPVGGTVTFTIDRILPGQQVLIALPVQHDNAPIAQFPEMVNTATLTAPGVAPVEARGVLYVQGNINPPIAKKSVDDAVVVPGQTVTFTVDITVPDNALDVFDVALVDTLADGFTPTGTVAVTCADGPCTIDPAGVAVASPQQQADGGWIITAMIGDLPAGSGEQTYRFVYDATIDASYEGTGTPAAGALVLSGSAGDPLVNSAVPRFNYSNALPNDTAPAVGTIFGGRGYPHAITVDITSPNVVLDKETTSKNVQVGERIGYQITLTNIGDAPAHDVTVLDDAASGDLRNVQIDAQDGLTIVDGWSLDDPDLTFVVDEIAPGETVTITYSGTSPPSAELSSVGDRTDPMLVRNTATLAKFSTAGGVEFAPGDVASRETWIHTPRIEVEHEVQGRCVVASGDTTRFLLDAGNMIPTPGLPAPIGTLYDASLTAILPAGYQYLAGSTTMTGAGALPAGTWEPTITQNSNGSTTLAWSFDEVPAYSGGGRVPVHIVYDATMANFAAYSGGFGSASYSGFDRSGEPARGGVDAPEYVYADTDAPGCQGIPFDIQKEPGTSAFVPKTSATGVFPGDNYQWTTSIGIGSEITGVQIVDTLPAGVSYTAGNTIITPTMGTGFTETITPMPNGTTVVVYDVDGPVAAGYYALRMTTKVATTGLVNGQRLVNRIELTSDQGISGDAACAAETMCSSGTVVVNISASPTITKTVIGDPVDTAEGGYSWKMQLDVRIPANQTYNAFTVTDLVNADATSYEPGVEGAVTRLVARTAGLVSATCIVGCATPTEVKVTTPTTTPLSIPSINTVGGADAAVGMYWILGNLSSNRYTLPSSTKERIMRFVFTTTRENLGTGTAGPYGVLPNVEYYGITDRAGVYTAAGGTAQTNQYGTITTYINNGTLRLASQATAEARVFQPTPTVAKNCVDLATGLSVERMPGQSLDDWAVTPTPIGTPNVRCDVSVTYDAPDEITVPIYDVGVTDTLTGGDADFAQVVSSQIPNGTTLQKQPVLNGDAGEWTITRMEPGQTVTTRWFLRVGTADTDADGAPNGFGEITNTAEIASLKLAETGSPYLLKNTFDGLRDSVTMAVHRPQLDIAKRIAPGAQPGLSSDVPAQAIPGEPVTYELRLDVAHIDDQGVIRLDDVLPAGWTYVPGSITVKSPDSAGKPQFAALFEPSVTPGAQTCAPASNHATGDTLSWVFDRSQPDRDQLWDSADRFDVDTTGWYSEYEIGDTGWDDLELTGGDPTVKGDTVTRAADPVEWDWFELLRASNPELFTADGFSFSSVVDDTMGFSSAMRKLAAAGGTALSGQGAQFSSLYVQYQAVPTTAALKCVTDTSAPALFRNTATLGLTRLDTNSIDAQSAALDTPVSGPLTITKTPDGARVVDGSTAMFDITVANHTGRALTNLVVTDDLTDADAQGLSYADGAFTAVPSAVTVTQSGLETTSQGQHIEFTIAALGDEQSVTISVPVVIPDGTANLSRLLNTAAVSANGYPGVPTDDGSVTVVNPSPAPDVAKTMVTTGGTPGLLTGSPATPFAATATMVLPSGAAYLDLAAADTLPDGLRFVDYGAVLCEFADGSVCDLDILNATPQVGSDGTTNIGWWLGDLAGVDQERTITFQYSVAIANTYANGSPVRNTDVLTNVVRAVSNDDDKVGAAPTAPIDPAAFDYVSADPGEASVVVTSPQLVLNKTASTTEPVAAGDTVTYTVTVQNVGSGDAFRVPVTDLPSNAVGAVVQGEGKQFLVDAWSAGDPDVRWVLPTVAAGTTATLEYTVTVRSDAETLGLSQLVNTVDVEPYRVRPNRIAGDALVDDVAPVEVKVPFAGSALSVQKFTGAECVDKNAPFVPGDDVQFCLLVANNGTGDASDVAVVDTPSNGFTYIPGSATLVGNDAAAEPAVVKVGDTNQLRWNLGTLEQGDEVRIAYSLGTAPAAAGSLPNEVLVTSTTSTGLPWPFNSSRGSATDTAGAVALAAGQEISKLPDLQSFEYDSVDGNVVTWQIVVTNPDAAPMTGVQVVDTLPEPFQYVSLTDAGTGGAVSTSGQKVTWNWDGPLAPQTSVTLTIEALLPPGLELDITDPDDTRYQNVASLTSDQIATPVENSALVEVGFPAPQPSIVKNIEPSSVGDGETFDTTLTVTIGSNGYAQTAHDLSVFDDMPAGWTYVGPATVTCLTGCASLPAQEFAVQPGTDDGSSIAWLIDTVQVPAASDVVFTITYSSWIGSPAQVGDSFVNTARVASNEFDLIDPGTDPRCADCEFTENPPPSSDEVDFETPRLVLDKHADCDLSTDDADSCDGVTSGDTVRYSVIVTNTGSAPAFDFDIADDGDAALRVADYASTPGVTRTQDWSADAPRIVWHVAGGLAAGASITVSYDVVIDVEAASELVNTASVAQYWSTPAGDHRPNEVPRTDVSPDEVTIDAEPASPTPTTPPVVGGLAWTGVNVLPLILLALTLVVMGAALAVAARRRKAVREKDPR